MAEDCAALVPSWRLAVWPFAERFAFASALHFFGTLVWSRERQAEEHSLEQVTVLSEGEAGNRLRQIGQTRHVLPAYLGAQSSQNWGGGGTVYGYLVLFPA